MIYLQIAANGLVLGGLYACIAVGFSLVWGVLNVINILHGSFIVLGSYVAYFAYVHLGIHPFISIVIAGAVLYALGYALQAGIINRVVAAPVLITLTLTFGLDLILNNAMLVAFTADYQAVNLAHPLGTLEIGPVFLPGDRVAAMVLALLLTRAAVPAVARQPHRARHRRGAHGPRGGGADGRRRQAHQRHHLRASARSWPARPARCSASSFPISPLNGPLFLGKAFVVCVLGGLGSVPGAMVGGLVLGVIESFGSYWFGPEHAVTLSFALLLLLLFVRPSGLMGRRGYE